MGPVEVVKAFPFAQSFFQIDVTFVAEQLIEFLLVRSMRSLHFFIQLWCCSPNVCVANAQNLGMPMKLSPELMAIVGPDFSDTKRKLVDESALKTLYNTL